MPAKKRPCTCAWCRKEVATIVELIDHVLASHHDAPAFGQPLAAA